MLLSVLTGCSLFGGGSVNPSDPTGGNNNPTSTNGGGVDLENLDDYVVTDPFWLNYDWDNFDVNDFFPPLGDANFTVDSANSVTGEFLADGETPFSLSVTDGAGEVWTLDIPANSLLSPETITMTALRDVKLGGDDLDGGVLLSPDGLTFFGPATLTVTGNGCGEDSVIFEGEHDGKNMTFTEYETGEGCVSATIWHFSTRVKGNGKGGGASVSMLELLVDMGNEILRQPLEAPEPPSITFKCPEYHNTNSNAKDKMLADYLVKCGDPEFIARQTIKSALANYRGQDAIVAQAMDVVMRLEQRMADKINMLIYRYKYQENKFAAICTLAFYGDWNKDKEYGIAYEEVYQWVVEVWNELMRELVEDHDYTRAHSLNNLKNFLKIVFAFRDVPLDTDLFDQKLSNAMTFNVEWKLDMTVYFTISSSGEVEVSMKLKEKSEFFGEGTGEGRLTRFYDPEGIVYVPSFPTFSNRAQISKFNPCMNNNITVGIDKCGTDFTAMARTEQGDFPVPFPDYPEPLIGYTTGDYNYSTGLYEFELVLNNFNEKCAEISIPQQLEEISHTLEFTIIHTPKDGVYIRVR
jgi:hypothetical protein